MCMQQTTAKARLIRQALSQKQRQRLGSAHAHADPRGWRAGARINQVGRQRLQRQARAAARAALGRGRRPRLHMLQQPGLHSRQDDLVVQVPARGVRSGGSNEPFWTLCGNVCALAGHPEIQHAALLMAPYTCHTFTAEPQCILRAF